MYQNRRYDSDFRTLQHLYQQGVFGRVTEFQNYYDIDNAPWMTAERADPYAPDSPPGGGMMYGLGTHSLDQTLVLFGRPKSVTAFTRVLRAGGKVKGKDFPKGCEDTFTIVLQYDDDGKGTGRRDLVCTIKTTIVSPAPLERMLKFWVRGTEGVFIKVRSTFDSVRSFICPYRMSSGVNELICSDAHCISEWRRCADRANTREGHEDHRSRLRLGTGEILWVSVDEKEA